MEKTKIEKLEKRIERLEKEDANDNAVSLVVDGLSANSIDGDVQTYIESFGDVVKFQRIKTFSNWAIV